MSTYSGGSQQFYSNSTEMLMGEQVAFLFFFNLSVLQVQQMEVPRPRVELELQQLAYTTARTTRDLSHVCNLHHGSRQRWVLNPLSRARDQTLILMDTSQVCFH